MNNLHILSLPLFLAAVTSWASDTPKENTPEEIFIYGEQGTTATATKLDLTIFETPQTVTAVSRNQLDDFLLTTVNAALDYTPGVTVEAVETDRTYYTARGFDIVNFQYDGVGIPFISGLNLGQQDTAIYEKVEVVKGASGLITGLANPSATINYVRKRPTDAPQFSVALGADEWQGRRVDADVSGSINTRLRTRAVVAYDEGNSYLDRHQDRTKLAYGVLELDVTNNSLLTLGHSYDNSYSQAVLWGALPLLYSDGSRTDYDVSTSSSPEWTFADTEQHQSFAEFKQAFGSDWSFNAILTRNKTDYDSELFYVYGAPDPDTEVGLTGLGSAYRRDEQQNNADAFFSGNFSFGEQNHQLVFGYSHSDTQLTESSYSDPVNGSPSLGGDWSEGNTPHPEFTSHDPATQESDIELTQAAFYFASRISLLDKLSLLLGARHTVLEQSGNSYGGQAKADAEKTVPYYGVTYEIIDKLMIYSSYSEVFKQQTWVDTQLQPLGPTLGKSRELGIKKLFNDSRAVLTLALFSSDQSNFGNFTGRNGDGIAIYQGIALESKGYEIELSGELLEGLNIGAGYTNIQLKNDDGEEIRPFVPSQLLKLSTSYRIAGIDGLKIGGVVKWQDSITTADALVEQEAYTLIDLAIHYQVLDNIGVSLNIENITDEKYLNSLYWDQAYYGAPRNIAASIRWNF